MNFQDWFIDPGWYPFLLLGPLTWFLLLQLDKRRDFRLRQKIGPRIEELVRGFDSQHRWARRLMTGAALFFFGLSLMRPTWGDSVNTVETRSSDIVICLDVSRSMLARDSKPSRIERAKQDIHSLVEGLKNERVALVAFAGTARLISPLTQDRRAFLELLDEVDFTAVRQGGTDLSKAVGVANRALGAVTEGSRAVLVLSDGEDQAEGDKVVDSASPVFTVGYGTTSGAKIPLPTEEGEEFLRDTLGDDVVTSLNATSLQQLAQQTKGRYLDHQDRLDPLRDILTANIRTRASAELAERSKQGRENYFQWPLLICLLFLALELSWGDKRLP